jgi:predicted polyphosphate/ATP-dependent NAD kinase
VTVVGIVANPAAGRDIRRLVAGASVSGHAEKAGMVFRVLAGLGAAGVPRALMMPAPGGLSVMLHRQLRAHAAAGPPATPLAELEELPMRVEGTAADSLRAVELLRRAGAAAIVVLGGDGTHRVVAKACADVPLCALSTGTNNVFPELREATVAGLATGLVATGRGGPDALRREAALRVEVEGAEPDLALVDVAASRERFVGARALWRTGAISDLLVTFANPAAVGLSAIAGMLEPLERGGGRGRHVRLAADGRAARVTVQVPLAPGLVVPVAVTDSRVLAMGEEVRLPPAGGSLALDGEREIERSPGARAAVRLVAGPLTIDVDAVMRHAAAEGFARRPPPV